MKTNTKYVIGVILICVMMIFSTGFLPSSAMKIYGTAFQSGTVEAVSGGVVVASTIASVGRDAMSNYPTYSLYVPTNDLKSTTIYLKLNGIICGIVTAVPGKSVNVNLYPLPAKTPSISPFQRLR